MKYLAAVLLLAIIIVGCAKPIPLENGPGGVKIVPSDDRPDIPRVNPVINDSEPEFQNPGEQPHTPLPIPQSNQTPGIDLDVPLGEPIGDSHPLINTARFPLLRHSPIRVTNNFLLGYDEQLRFDFDRNSSGRIIFGQDRDENIGTFLHFEKDKPVFEYSVRLLQGTFYDVSGRDIQILGHTYTIAEATNASVTLYGKDVPLSIVFADNESLFVNGSKQGGTFARVKPNMISYTLTARGRDGILLNPGESVSDAIGRPKLASLIFDIRYLGAPIQNTTVVKFDKTKFGYRLNYDGPLGPQQVPLVEVDGAKLVLGKVGENLRLKACTNCIAPDDLFLLTAPKGESYIFRYSGISNESKLLILRDLAGNRYDYKFVGNPGSNARTDITIGGFRFPVTIGKIVNNSANITVQQGFRNGRAELVTKGGFILRIGDPTNTTLPVEVIIPSSATRGSEEHTFINLTYNASMQDWIIAAGNLTFVEDEETLDSFGTTGYGMAVVLDKNKRDLPSNRGDEATLLIPRSQTFGVVRLEG